ncbi:4'-phosphopantetheinyl transferase superfamily protein [Pedobacter sp. SYSU D00535]|uniref:4'-phosphopantetheinyl transferase family protein n=1 Tax=Pedobacter sp. SYSU D00535 TaxID=2810308 RepID=UPI001A978816|nr:4'-phosphopantetheinyl transferase superfamily protein [Pedobacter sp. SYSU D00535]
MALAYYKHLDATTAFGVWKIEETAEELYSSLQLNKDEEAYLQTLNNGKRNLHWLSTRVLLRKMLNTEKYIDCQVDEDGKPYLVNFPHHISFSHSFDYAAVMVSEDKPVGIDIELVKTKIDRVAKKFLCPDELAFIDNVHRIEHLYICWCAKEAIYKLQGKRNVSFKNHIRLNRFNYQEEGCFSARLEVDQECKSFEVYYEAFKDYMIGYVSGCRTLG